MRLILSIILGIALFSPGISQGVEFVNFKVSEQVPYWLLSRSEYIKVTGNYIVSDFLNPLYFEEDFNGDGSLDIAVAIKEKDSQKKGILILHGGSLEAYVFGAGTEFGDLKHFDWIDLWWVYRESTAEETLFSEDLEIIGSKDLYLDRVAIRVGKLESTSNLIYWDGKEYIWIHTGD